MHIKKAPPFNNKKSGVYITFITFNLFVYVGVLPYKSISRLNFVVYFFYHQNKVFGNTFV